MISGPQIEWACFQLHPDNPPLLKVRREQEMATRSPKSFPSWVGRGPPHDDGVGVGGSTQMPPERDPMEPGKHGHAPHQQSWQKHLLFAPLCEFLSKLYLPSLHEKQDNFFHEPLTRWHNVQKFTVTSWVTSERTFTHNRFLSKAFWERKYCTSKGETILCHVLCVRLCH